jgi:uncharacterized protein with ParB-like and HNH nuclease domain
MSFQAPITISDAISRIRSRRLLLPAIQREFVWEPQKVEWLFDSLLQGYPIGSFLFWEVHDDEVKHQYRHYEFLTTFRERYHTHNSEFNTHGHVDFEAVLDGQQRLTALNIGLTGTYAYKKPRVWWENSEYALPTRKLYLNVTEPAPATDNETGLKYEFKFLTQEEYTSNTGPWFSVGKILELPEAYDLNHMLRTAGYQDSEFASRALSKLHSVVHTERIINYYTVKQANMEKALNVFVRVNSGGEALSLSDMLMSTAIANWTIRDAKKEIFGLVDQARAKGFFIGKDLVLKACLYLYNSDIRYKVSNFTATQVKPFEDNWDNIQSSILAVFELIRSFGYDESSLTSKNALLPIVYWVHHKRLAGTIISSVGLRNERDIIRRWLHTMLLKSVFGSSADTILAAIRKAFVGEDFREPYVMSGIESFPSGAIATILRKQGKDPQVTDEFIESLLLTQYEDRQAFTILALLAPGLDYKNKFHKDHLHPASGFKPRALKAAGIAEADSEFYRNTKHWNSILNLAHLDENENKSKNDRPLADWTKIEAARQKISVEKFCSDHLLPVDPALLAIGSFRKFIAERRKIVDKQLRDLL